MVDQKLSLNPVDPAGSAVAELLHKVFVPSRNKAQVAKLGFGSLADLVKDAEHRERVGTELQCSFPAPHHVGDLEAFQALRECSDAVH
jgi:hypothetical protein